MPQVAALRWLVTAPTAGVGRAQLHALPNTRHALPTPRGVGGWARGVAWLPVQDGAVALPFPLPPAVVLADGVVRLSAVSKHGTTSATVSREAVEHTHTPDRVGADVRLCWSDGRWNSSVGALPDAAARTGTLMPWSVGAGVVWIDEDTVYRAQWTADGRTRVDPLGPARSTDTLRAGPHGALVVCTDGQARGAAPGEPLVPLHAELDRDASIYWSDDGRELVAARHVGACRFDLVSGYPTDVGPDDVPTGFDDRIVIGGEGAFRWLAPRAVRVGHRLAGPDARVWSLLDGTCSPPILGERVAATDDAWVSLSGRRVRWLAQDGLRPLGAATLPDRLPTRAMVADGPDVIVTQWDGTARRVTRGGHVTTCPPRATENQVEDTPSAAWRALGLQHTVTVGGRTWCWSDEGLLVSE